jgi:hypothetical protein
MRVRRRHTSVTTAKISLKVITPLFYNIRGGHH